MSQVTDEVIALEKGFWSDDKEHFERHVADDSINIIAPMGYVTKQQALEMDFKPWKDVRFSEVKAIEVAPDVVTIAYHGEGEQEGKGKHSVMATSVWAKRDGRWQLVMSSHQPYEQKQDKAA